MVSPEDHICWGAANPNHHPHELQVRELSAAYPRAAQPTLDRLHFSIHCGHTLAVMGPNGAGKSTLLNVLAGLMGTMNGEVLWDGRALHHTRREVAWLPQRSQVDLSFPITVRELVEMGRYPALGPWRAAGEHDALMVDKAMHTLHIADLQRRQIRELSGGQLQRVFLARALAQEAHILLLDEPFTGLDAPGAGALGELLGELAHEGRLVIASYHDVDHAASYFDYALLLRKGKQMGFGPCAQTLTRENLQCTYS